MDLSDLTLDELCELKTGIEIVESAVRTMHDLTPDVVVTLGDTETVITAGPVLRRAASVVLVEDDADAVPPVGSFVVARVAEASGEAGDAVARVRGAATKAGQSKPNPAMERVVGDDGLLRGPWLEEEDALLVSLRARRLTYTACAQALGRPLAATGFRARGLNSRIEAEAAALLAETVPDPVDIREQVAVAESGTVLTEPKTPAGGADAPQSAPAHAGPAGAPASRQPPAEDATPDPAPPDPHGFRSARGAGGPAVPEDLRGPAREIWIRMASEPFADAVFDAELDLDLAEGLVSGRALAEIALDLDLDAAQCKRRWTYLKAPIIDARGQVTLSGQEALLVVLRRRAMQARGAAA